MLSDGVVIELDVGREFGHAYRTPGLEDVAKDPKPCRIAERLRLCLNIVTNQARHHSFYYN